METFPFQCEYIFYKPPQQIYFTDQSHIYFIDVSHIVLSRPKKKTIEFHCIIYQPAECEYNSSDLKINIHSVSFQINIRTSRKRAALTHVVLLPKIRRII